MPVELYSPHIADVRIAAPCKVGWENMKGDEKIRFCSQCELHVYNVSAMSENESQKLFAEKKGQMCLRFFRREDGTIIFEDCPVGLRKIRDGVRYALRAVSTFLAMAMSVAASMAATIEDAATKNETEKSSSKTKLMWTLVENGPTNRAPFKFTPPKPNPIALAQLGGPDRYTLFNAMVNYPKLGSDFSAADAFSSAMSHVEKRKFKLAEVDFQTAIKACDKPETDPMFREFVISEYANLLKRTGKYKKARTLISENKAISGMRTVDKISKSD